MLAFLQKNGSIFGRGLNLGSIFMRDGVLIAGVAREGLLRQVKKP